MGAYVVDGRHVGPLVVVMIASLLGQNLLPDSSSAALPAASLPRPPFEREPAWPPVGFVVLFSHRDRPSQVTIDPAHVARGRSPRRRRQKP